MKQIVTLFALLSLLVPSAFSATTFTADGLEFNVISDTDHTVSITKYLDNFKGGYYTIPEKVTYQDEEYTVVTIGYNAFFGCTNLVSVTFPESITGVSASIFSSCSNLSSVTLTGKLKVLSMNMFKDCVKLQVVNIPEGVTTIGATAFRGCKKLKSVVIPGTVTTLKQGAFSECSALQTVKIPASVTTIEQGVFEECSALSNVEIPESVTELGTRAFARTGIQKIKVPSGVTTLMPGMFYECSQLAEVDLPDGIESIGGYAFYLCEKLESIKLPAHLKTISESAFEKCGLTKMEIPEEVTSLGLNSFKGCIFLKIMKIGRSVTSIDARAFDGCTGLGSIYSYNPKPPVLGVYVFNKVPTGTCVLYVPEDAVGVYRTETFNGWSWGIFTNILPFPSSAVDDIRGDEASVDVSINGSSLQINGAKGSQVAVYNADGRCEWQTPCYDGEPVELGKGLHIVRAGNSAVKVSL